MKRITLLLTALMLVAFSMQAVAGDADHGKMEKKSDKMEMKADKMSNVTGEIVDTGCYMEHGAKGADHASCATKCIAGGMPMGLLTDSGTLYLITMNHDNPDAYNKLKEMAAKKVVVTGKTSERSGMKSIDAMSFKMAEPKKDM